MTTNSSNAARDVLAGAFGFDPEESAAHFLVHIPAGSTVPVDISEHLSWDPERIQSSIHYGTEREDGQVRCHLPRSKWNEIAEVVRAELNARLKKAGRKPGKWKTGCNPITRILGKELTLLAWAIEDADPALIPTAIANWQGLTPEERWWLYTMTAAATGNAVTDRNRGWRKAVRFALTENPVTHRVADKPVVPEFFRLVSESLGDEELPSTTPPGYLMEKPDEEYTVAKPIKRPTRR
ncbi:DUF3780 domain-containing protein [Nitrospiraceae bacterium AH_259_D15_M11_P09]|nr:DUF3780 domain-containing protein [Nitrospiraceae bacterium AH_259_D15_M11_P09]